MDSEQKEYLLQLIAAQSWQIGAKADSCLKALHDGQMEKAGNAQAELSETVKRLLKVWATLETEV
ncbi:hypothetical protein [Necropsobacter rosorum]|uniref:hypothetical protein n=1 Tax=Necropsobacter rosorum TaxID=908285 RepID=UPI00050949BC